MDDFVISNLHESRNEWCARLISIFTPLVTEGIRSVFNEAWRLCQEADDVGKYLMTFQNLLSRIPKWNENIIADERKRIEERSGCTYLEDLITCVHVIQLKILTCIRVGNKQKKIDITIPKLDPFIHKVYIHVARKIYMNVYLFEKNVSPLAVQKNNRELEMIIQECILMAIRESIPTEQIIRAYLDESVEQEEEVVVETIEDPVVVNGGGGGAGNGTGDENGGNDTGVASDENAISNAVVPTISPEQLEIPSSVNRLAFSDYDSVLHMDSNEQETINAPKTIERLEEISADRAYQRKLEEDEEDLEDRIQISADSIDLNELGILNMDGTPAMGSSGSSVLDADNLSLDDLIKSL